MSIEQMKYMLTLAQEKKISYAAKKCYISQPALSQQLVKIEQELGITMFVRINNEYIPTKDGNTMLEAFRNILHTYQNAFHRLTKYQSSLKKTITLGLPSLRAAILYTYIYPRFKDRFPDYDLRLVETSVRATPELLDNKTIDFGLYSPLLEIPKYCKTYSYYPIAHEELVLVTSKKQIFSEFPEDRGSCLDIQMLNGQQLALYEKTSIVRNLLDSAFEKYQVSCSNIIELKTGSVLIEFAKKNIAPSIIPHMFALNSPELKIIHLHPTITQEIGLLSLGNYQGTDIGNYVVLMFQEAFHSTLHSHLTAVQSPFLDSE